MINLKQTQKALDQLSDSIQILGLLVDSPVTKHYVDISGSLNAKVNALSDLVDKFKGSIKAKLVEQGETIKQGEALEAVMQEVNKSILDTKKVKEFLGKKLSKFLTDRRELHLIFRPKT